jgi:hypothetical protein
MAAENEVPLHTAKPFPFSLASAPGRVSGMMLTWVPGNHFFTQGPWLL